MAHEEALAIRKIIITAEVGRLRAEAVDTRTRVPAVLLSAVEGARIIHLVAEGDRMVVAVGDRLRLVRVMVR